MDKRRVAARSLGEVADGLPDVPAPESGFLAVGVSVKNRAANWDLIVDEATETYLLEVWPNPSPRPLRDIKSTDGLWSEKRPTASINDPGDAVRDATVKLGGPVRWDPETESPQ